VAGSLGDLPVECIVCLELEVQEPVSLANAYAAHTLLRAVLDHIPPLLGCADFKAAANNYSSSRTDSEPAMRAKFRMICRRGAPGWAFR
jgi:hypothetical protein